MSCNNYNVEGNGGATGKTTVAINSSSMEGIVPSIPERRLSIKLTSRWSTLKKNIVTNTKNFFVSTDTANCKHIPDKYSHVFRHKSRWEHIKLSGAVCGMEFCYAAETAFVTPILLSLGLTIKYVTIIWCLSPLIGLILSPILGSMSDSCQSKYGRRRPFIILYSIGLILGLILVPCGHHIGVALGDIGRDHASIGTPSRTLSDRTNIFEIDANTNRTLNYERIEEFPVTEHYDSVQNDLNHSLILVQKEHNISLESYNDPLLLNNSIAGHIQPWSIAFTVIGVVLLDFSADSCQSPARTYLLDVSIPTDHASGLSTFTIMAGLGGSLGYAMGAVDWDKTMIGALLGGQIHAVFTINTIIFLICLVISLSSFSEIPLTLLKDPKMYREYQEKLHRIPGDKSRKEISVISTDPMEFKKKEQETVKETEIPTDSFIVNEADVKKEECSKNSCDNDSNENIPDKNGGCKELDVSQNVEIKITNEMEGAKDSPKLKEYLMSIVHMPRSLRILSLTNLLGWMSCICYMLYFTDFVGECVFGGDPQDAHDSPNYATFQEGVKFGCWGLALFCISCSFYSLFVEALVEKVGAKTVYIGTQLGYSVSTMIMALTRHKVAVILLSPIAGIMYSSLLTLPYLLIANYHSKNQFSKKKKLSPSNARGMGTDVAAVSSMMFLAQLCLSVSMGNVAEAVGSSAVPIFAAALLSACGAISATQVVYLNI